MSAHLTRLKTNLAGVQEKLNAAAPGTQQWKVQNTKATLLGKEIARLEGTSSLQATTAAAPAMVVPQAPAVQMVEEENPQPAVGSGIRWQPPPPTRTVPSPTVAAPPQQPTTKTDDFAYLQDLVDEDDEEVVVARPDTAAVVAEIWGQPASATTSSLESPFQQQESIQASSVPPPAPVASNSVVAMFAQAPVLTSDGQPTTASSIAQFRQHRQVATAEDDEEVDSPSAPGPLPPITQPLAVPASHVGMKAVDGGRLEQLRKLRAGLAAESAATKAVMNPTATAFVPGAEKPNTSPRPAAGVPAPPMAAGATGVSPPLKPLGPSTANVNKSLPLLPAAATTSTGGGKTQGKVMHMAPSPADTNDVAIVNPPPAAIGRVEQKQQNGDRTRLAEVQVTVQRTPTEPPSDSPNFKHLVSNTSDCAYFAFPDEEELKALEADPRFECKATKADMERVFLGQLPYTTSETLVQWIAFHFAGGIRLFHVEKITKNSRGSGAGTAPTKVPTGCFHAYIEKDESSKLLVGLHKKILVDTEGMWVALFSKSVREDMHPTFPDQVGVDTNKEDKRGLSMLSALRNYCAALKADRQLRVPGMPYGLVVAQLATSSYDPVVWAAQKKEAQEKDPRQEQPQGQHQQQQGGRGRGAGAPTRGGAQGGRGGYRHAPAAAHHDPMANVPTPRSAPAKSWADIATKHPASVKATGGGPPACVDF